MRLPSYTVKGFGGGLNRAVSSFKLRDDELRDCQNVRVDLKGSLKPRAGLRKYDISGAHLTGANEIKGAYRYSRSDGARKMLIQSSGSIAFADANDGVFAVAGTVPVSIDGFSRFAQWRDTVFASGTTGNPGLYNPDYSASFDTAECRGAMSRAVVFDVATVVGNGAWITGNDYAYRFTLDYYAGENFLCEGFPLHQGSNVSFNGTLVYDSVADAFWSRVVTPAATDEINVTKGVEAGGYTVFSFPAQAKTINIYRSVGVPTGTTAAALVANSRIIGTAFYWIGSIEVADFVAAAIGDTLFTDYGDPVGSGPALEQYVFMERPPASRYVVTHKGRMWYAWNAIEIADAYTLTGNEYQSLSLVTSVKPSRIYFSEPGQPTAVRFQSWLEVQETDGEGITGLVSWKNRALFAFKANSIIGIYGGDGEVAPGVPDMEIEMVDEAVGCIAPNSIAFGEGGIIFLSNRGVMYFAGTTPQELNSKLIDPVLAEISADRKAAACGVYDNKTRKYYLALYNTVLEYDFFTQTWVKHVYMDGSANLFGFNQFVEIKRGDEPSKLLATCTSSGAAMTTTGALQVLDDVYYENDEAESISWNAKTKYFDCGEAEVIKTFKGILMRVKTPQPITVDYDVDEGSVTGSLTVTTTAAHTWDEVGLNWETYPPEHADHFWGGIVQGETLLRFPQDVCGRRIGFTFSGEAHLPDIEIQGFSILFTREEREEV